MHSTDQVFIALSIISIDDMPIHQEAADHLFDEHGVIGFAPVFANHEDATGFAPETHVIELKEDGKPAAQA